MSLDLRVLLAEAYRTAALNDADMGVGTRALESIREAASGPDAAFDALNEVLRQAGLTSETGLVPALTELKAAIESARIENDVEAIRSACATGAGPGWIEFRRRFASALARFADDIVEGIGRADLPLSVEQRAVVDRWLEQVRFGQMDKWDRALDLFESLGRDPVIEGADRARFLARAVQVHLYFTGDREAARRALDEALALTADPAAPATSRAEVLSAAGQFEVDRGNRDRGKQFYQDAIRIDPHFEDAYKWLGDAFAEDPDADKRDLAAAEAWYDRGIENAPGGTLNISALAKLLGHPEQYRSRRLRIAELWQHARRVTPKGSYGLYVAFAQIELDNGEVEEAGRLVGEALKLDRHRLDAWLLAARIRTRQDQPLAALADYGQGWAADSEAFVFWEEVAAAAAAACASDTADTVLGAVQASFEGAPAVRVAELRGRVFRETGQWAAAESESAAILAIDHDDDAHRRRLALIHNARGNGCYESSDYPAARQWYERAIEQTPDDAVLLGNLALALEHDPDGDRVDRLRDAIAALDRAIALGAPSPDPDHVQRRDTLAARYGLASRYGPAVLDLLPAPPPIGLDVSPDLLEQVVEPGTARLAPSCLDAVSRVRRRVEAERGITLPGVNFREWTAATDPGQYLTVVGGLSVTRGSVPPDRHLLFRAPVPAGFPPDLPPAEDPLSGEFGFWVPASALDGIEGEFTAWTALDFAIHDLARVYLQNVRTEFSPDDLVRLVENADVSDTDGLKEDPATLQRLTQTVRALVAEGASVAAIAAITLLVRDAPDCSVAQLVEDARMLPGVRATLRGNDERTDRVLLGPQLSRMVRAAVWREDPEPSLAIDPANCQALLSRVRELGAGPGSRAIVTDDDLRPFVRWVLEIEFPDLPVLARRELLEDRSPETVVDLDAPVAEVHP